MLTDKRQKKNIYIYSPLSVSMWDWFQDPRCYQTADAQVPYSCPSWVSPGSTSADTES